MSKVKFCGLSRLQDIEAANILKPNFIGFVFAKSRREVSAHKAQELRKNLNSEICSVGVFVDSEMEFIAQLLKDKIINIAQLHGNESADFIENLKIKTSAKIIKAIALDCENPNFQNLQDKFSEFNADFLLLDSAKAGSGKSFDWRVLRQILKNEKMQEIFSQKCFLAGGVNLSNLRQALEFKPFCIDVSSGIEENGVKDFEKMSEFIQIIKGAK